MPLFSQLSSSSLSSHQCHWQWCLSIHVVMIPTKVFIMLVWTYSSRDIVIKSTIKIRKKVKDSTEEKVLDIRQSLVNLFATTLNAMKNALHLCQVRALNSIRITIAWERTSPPNRCCSRVLTNRRVGGPPSPNETQQIHNLLCVLSLETFLVRSSEKSPQISPY